jgi:hypothetical protein
MIRLLGFLLGSAASLGAIVLLLGIPDLRVEDVPAPRPAPVETSIAIATPAPELPPALASPELPPSEVLADQPMPDSIEVPESAGVLLAEDVNWYSFWNPFRSEIAANGFVSRLEEVTGFDYRVVKINTGVYEVTFAYENDVERRDKLSRIASATGLELPDS